MKCNHCKREMTEEQYSSYTGGLCDLDCYMIGETLRLQYVAERRKQEAEACELGLEEAKRKREKQWSESFLFDSSDEARDNEEWDERLLANGM